MPSFEHLIFAYLSASSPITTLVQTRIFPGRAPQNVAYPYIKFLLLMFAKYGDTSAEHVGRDGILRAGCQPALDRLLATARRRVTNPRQIANLPRKTGASVTVFCEHQ